MIKDIMTANESAAPNSREMEILKEHFPSCFRLDGSFDLGRFQEYLSDKIAVVNEGYELKFLGKNYARLLASMDTATVIVPDLEHNRRPENANSKNVYISGDNLDGLKHLLKSYAKKVKCIYIDPPYNTGSDGFVYADQFHFTPDELSEKLSISTGQAQRILDLTKRGSASHSAWLMFMYPRLLLARDLLCDDGAIFISIDDHEQANLKLICDDIFGEENCLGCICRSTGQTTGQDSGGLGSSFDYAFVYGRKPDLDITGLPLTDHDLKRFDQEDDFGKYAYDQLRKTGSNDHREDRPNMYYAIKDPDGNDVYPTAATGYDSCWRVERKTYDQLAADGYILWKKTTRNGEKVWWPYVKYYLEGRSKRPSPLWTELDGNKKATREVRALFDNVKVFDYVKPVDFIKKIVQISPNMKENDIVLDFFSGSATTAHAIMSMGKKYRYIMVQLPTVLDENVTSQKLAKEFLEGIGRPGTLDQIGIERIFRAARTIQEAYPSTTADLGFQHFTLAEPSGPTLDKLERFSPDDNGLAVADSILDCFGVPTVLATWLVRDGYGFTAPVKAIDFAGSTGYYMDKHLYLIEPGLSNAAIAAITDKFETDGTFNPENVVMFGYSFQWTETESLKTNLARLRVTEKNLRINFDIRY